MKKQTGFKFGLAMLVGAGLGYTAGLFVDEKVKKKQKKLVEEKIATLKKILTDKDIHAQIKKAFNEKSEEAFKLYSDAKDKLIQELAKTGESFEHIDQKKYIELTKQAVESATQQHKWPKKQVDQLVKLLEKDFDKIKKARK